jgi:hypothetical protein
MIIAENSINAKTFQIQSKNNCNQMIVDEEDYLETSSLKNKQIFISESDSDSEDEEILLEWGFDQILPSENPEKIFLPMTKINEVKKSVTSSASTAMSNLQEEILNKNEPQLYSEFHHTFGVVSLSSEENRKKFLEECDGFKDETKVEIETLDELSEFEVTVSANNNDHKNNKKVISEVMKRIDLLKKKSEKVIRPYSEIHFSDPNLVDYYLSDFLELDKKKKRTITGKKIEDGNYVPPLPSEILEKFRKERSNFSLRFHYNSSPFSVGNKNFGYCFSVRCEKLNIDQFYNISDVEKLPFGKAREYVSQAILMLLYPNIKKWVDLLKIFNFKI